MRYGVNANEVTRNIAHIQTVGPSQLGRLLFVVNFGVYTILFYITFLICLLLKFSDFGIGSAVRRIVDAVGSEAKLHSSLS